MMNKIEVTTCSDCPFCIVSNNKIICYANLKFNESFFELDEALIEDDRLDSCPLNEGVLVIAKEQFEEEIAEESEK